MYVCMYECAKCVTEVNDTKIVASKHGCSCVPAVSGCWYYNNVCLKLSTVSTNADNIPSGCNPYHPSASWGFYDYVAICQHFGGRSACSSVDYDRHGGRCSNFQAILGYEHDHQTWGSDVWVSQMTFNWNPVRGGGADCTLMPDPPGTVVYACR